ncbi:MAG TPA: type II toxin-antitoxin system HicA family toxin [archaeon]|nr:type II toxin-antitoxin system HicA family toxin [archaeon]
MKLPIISGGEVIKIRLKKGYYIRNQKGSHVHLRHPEKIPVTVPNHKVISKKTLNSIVKATGLNESDFE